MYISQQMSQYENDDAEFVVGVRHEDIEKIVVSEVLQLIDDEADDLWLELLMIQQLQNIEDEVEVELEVIFLLGMLVHYLALENDALDSEMTDEIHQLIDVVDDEHDDEVEHERLERVLVVIATDENDETENVVVCLENAVFILEDEVEHEKHHDIHEVVVDDEDDQLYAVNDEMLHIIEVEVDEVDVNVSDETDTNEQ